MNNADRLNCKMVVEGSSGATTFKADEILNKKGITIVPDFLATGGGVTSSYFEWLKNIEHVSPGRMTKRHQEKQNLMILETLGYQLPKNSPHMNKLRGAAELDIVNSALEQSMQQATLDHWNYSLANGLSLRDACYCRSMEKLYEHLKQTGIVI